MGTLKLDFGYLQQMRWPNKCAYCGAEADDKAKTSFRVFAGELRYYLVAFGWTEHKYTISYPVCRKHNKFVYTRMPSSGFIGNLFGFLMIALALLATLPSLWDITGNIFKYLTVVLAATIYGLMIFCLFISPFILKPVRISFHRKTLAKLYIRNTDCFREFRLLNRDIIHGMGKCVHSCNIFTCLNTQPAPKKDPEIPKELKVFDFIISEHQGRPVVKGKYMNQSIYFLKRPFGSFSVGEAGNEILFFPFLNIEKSNSPEIIEPFEEGEFCHYVSEKETASIKELGSKPLILQFIKFDKSQNKD